MPDLERMLKLAHKVNLEQGGTYHRLDLGEGVVLEGEYDMDRYVDHYGLPEDMTGTTALDVGTASGYFAYEMERRGAHVTAIDIYGSEFIDEVSAAKGSQVRYVQQDVYGLTPVFGEFDLVMCGSLLLHLPDPLGAIRAMRSVCGGRLTLATYITDDPDLASRQVCEFLGDRATDGEYYTYWRFAVPALLQMFRVAGFNRVEAGDTFLLESRSGYRSFHGVVHGWV